MVCLGLREKHEKEGLAEGRLHYLQGQEVKNAISVGLEIWFSS